MPIRSQAQARFEFAHPEKFGGREHVAAKVRAAGGMKALPKRRKKRRVDHPLMRFIRD